MLYTALFDRILVRIPPERAHHWAMSALRAGFASDRVAATSAARAIHRWGSPPAWTRTPPP
jgi:hypothetical protein